MSRSCPYIYITGGCRSGKSTFAQRAAESFSANRVFLATARVEDAEMRERVLKHQAARGKGWRLHELTINEAGELWRALPKIVYPGEALLFDCLTLWVASILENGGGPKDFGPQCDLLAEALGRLPCPVVVVNNEVGMGVVPISPVGRAFRDMVGIAGQAVANAATDAIFMVSGLPVPLKGRLPAFATG